jgi:hypothetical protein
VGDHPGDRMPPGAEKRPKFGTGSEKIEYQVQALDEMSFSRGIRAAVL